MHLLDLAYDKIDSFKSLQKDSNCKELSFEILEIFAVHELMPNMNWESSIVELTEIGVGLCLYNNVYVYTVEIYEEPVKIILGRYNVNKKGSVLVYEIDDLYDFEAKLISLLD